MRRFHAWASVRPIRFLPNVAVASIVGVLAPNIARSAESANAMRIVVASGPVAGTYALPQGRISCVSTAQGIAASYKYFNVPDKNKPGVDLRVRDAKSISEAQIVVDNPTERGAKHGSFQVTFGNRNEYPVTYLVFVPDAGTLSQTDSGRAFALDGHTKDGIAIRATATCAAIETM